jgi:chemotaxis protein MotB
MTRLLLLTVLVTACVPKARHNRELDTLRQAEAAVKTDLELTQDRLAAAQDALAHETDANEALTARLKALDAKNQELRTQLTQVGEELARLGTRSAAQTAAKKKLEELVGQLQTDAEAARDEAEEAARRAAELDAERARLAEETARLQAEKAELEKTTAEYDALVDRLKDEVQSGQVTITELSGKLTVNMSNAILFASGSTTVKPEGKAALEKVAGVLFELKDREVRVEGHTDNVPVGSGAAYADNWELSALRASGVVRLLVEGGMDPLNIAAVGYGEHRPAVPNDTRENRATNRRTEIVLVPRLVPE